MTLEMADTVGNITSVDFTLSTGSTSVRTNNGTVFTDQGAVLDNGVLELVGAQQTDRDSSTSQLPYTMAMKLEGLQ